MKNTGNNKNKFSSYLTMSSIFGVNNTSDTTNNMIQNTIPSKKSNPYRVLSKITTDNTKSNTPDTMIEKPYNPSTTTDSNYNNDTMINSNINVNKNQSTHISNLSFTRDKLQEAIIWSEIVREPLCKRRKRRSYGN
jgi:hypothetical protein